MIFRKKGQLISCETVSVFAKNEQGFEESFNSNRVGARNRCTFIAMRLYFDIGFYGHRAKHGEIECTTSKITALANNSIEEAKSSNSQSCDIM